MRSEDLLQQLDILAGDPRFSALSALDLQNLLTAIELCGLGFGSGSQLGEHLDRLLRDEWPNHSSSQGRAVPATPLNRS